MNRQRLKEWGKNILILLLAVSAVYLSGRVGLFEHSGEQMQMNNPAGEENGASLTRYEQTTGPLAIMITSAENTHHGVKYSGEALTEVYSWLTASLGEALGSSGAPQEVSARQWEDALYCEGVFFDYLYAQSVSSMARWLGVEVASDVSLHTARRFCLAVEDNSVALYYIRTLDGKAYRCQTALNASRFSERIGGYVPNSAVFAFEMGGEYEDIDPYYCIMEQLTPMQKLTPSNPLQSTDSSIVLESFGMNPLVANNYPESDGTQVHVEDEQSLRISADGRVIYSRMGGDETTQLTVPTSDVVARAYALAASMPGGEGCQLHVSNVSFNQDTETYLVRFDYVVDGLVVCFGGRASAMEFVIDGAGVLRRADLMCRSYAVQGSEAPMPERQALAVISSQGGGEPMLCYTDSGENVTLGWVIKH